MIPAVGESGLTVLDAVLAHCHHCGSTAGLAMDSLAIGSQPISNHAHTCPKGPHRGPSPLHSDWATLPKAFAFMSFCILLRRTLQLVCPAARVCMLSVNCNVGRRHL